MNRGPVIHGALLAAALAFAYQTWTRDKTVKVVRGDFVLWDGRPADVVSIDYDQQDKRTTHIERRSDENGSYLWATVTRTTTIPAPKPPAPPAGLDAGVAPEPVPEPPPEIKTTTTEFPVGKAGEDLFAGVAPMRALRELGKLTDEQRTEYELDKADTRLTVSFKSGARALILGGRVYGGSDRFVVDPDSGKAYVVPGEVLQSLAGGDSALRDGQVFPFEATQVATAVIKTATAEKKLVRGEKPGETPQAEKQTTWAYAETPTEPDQTLANFMGRVDKLTPSEYLPEQTREGLTQVLRIDYAGKDGKALGHLELLSRPGATEGATEYFVFSERTRVLAKTHPGSAKKVDKDLETLFSPAE